MNSNHGQYLDNQIRDSDRCTDRQFNFSIFAHPFQKRTFPDRKHMRTGVVWMKAAVRLPIRTTAPQRRPGSLVCHVRRPPPATADPHPGGTVSLSGKSVKRPLEMGDCHCNNKVVQSHCNFGHAIAFGEDS